jgi:UDP-N-acetylglucosamine--N-acetylmuramyl-(pentapeptide) pyrophosphoryl-undecaprenol N-acetylglucosamine transferase
LIVVTGGGTGGHLVIAKAIIEELNKRGIKPIYMGSTKGQDRDWFANHDGLSKRYFFETRGVVNQGFFGKIGSMLKIFKATKTALRAFDEYKVTKVISVGGFSAAPASFGAVISKKDFYIHEQNSVVGKLNRTLRAYAKEFFSSYDEDSTLKDYPVRDVFFKTQRVREEIKSVIFLGGSQGARSINNFAIKVAPYLEAKNIKIIHQTGKEDYLEIAQEYKRLGIVADVFNFSNDIDKKIASADFAISRAGASSMWELSANGLPTLFIPYPYAAEDHQYYNAKFLEEQELCFLQRETEIDEEYFYNTIENAPIKDISSTLIDTIKPNGVQSIVDKILEG